MWKFSRYSTRTLVRITEELFAGAFRDFRGQTPIRVDSTPHYTNVGIQKDGSLMGSGMTIPAFPIVRTQKGKWLSLFSLLESELTGTVTTGEKGYD